MKDRVLSLREATAAVAAVALMATTVGVMAYTTAPPEAQASSTHNGHHAVLRTREAVAFRTQMRKLWEDHIVWTRMYIVSAVADLPDADAAAGRLLANQDDIGDAIKPYYGDEAGEAVSGLLRDHIMIAVDILNAAKSGDSAGVEEANARWHENGDEIADFLATANPRNWPQSEMRAMMAEHLDRTLEEAVARLNEDWDGDVAAYDQIHLDILHMADMLSRGIIKQFPNKF